MSGFGELQTRMNVRSQPTWSRMTQRNVGAGYGTPKSSSRFFAHRKFYTLQTLFYFTATDGACDYKVRGQVAFLAPGIGSIGRIELDEKIAPPEPTAPPSLARQLGYDFVCLFDGGVITTVAGPSA